MGDNSNSITFGYEGYISRFGYTRRPALVRYSRDVVRMGRYEEEVDVINLFIDGKVVRETIMDDGQVFLRTCFVDGVLSAHSCSIVIIEPIYSKKQQSSCDTICARPFRIDSKEDWSCLFYDTSEFDRLGDRLAYANIAIALDKFCLDEGLLKEAINTLQEPRRSRILELIKQSSYGLSRNKIEQINTLMLSLGHPADSFFPVILEEAARQLGVSFFNSKVHSLADMLFLAYEKKLNEKIEIENPTLYVRFIQWLDNVDKRISMEDFNACFAFLDEARRGQAIKRFFYDVKRGIFQYNAHTLQSFSSQNYQYYSSLRYIFETWPSERNVSTEFLLDCLKTYEQTNQVSFQVSNGILDWAIQKAIEVGRPIKMHFYDWLCYCQGGIVINDEFRGFADFEIQYELDDLAFEEESVEQSIRTIKAQKCERLSHEEKITLIDPITKQHQSMSKPVWEDRWKPLGGAKKYVDLFVNWERRDVSEPEEDVFTPEMIDHSIVRSNVESYLMAKYGTLTPFISERKTDDIVKMFAYETRMRVKMDNNIVLGENPGVDDSVVKQRVKERMVELFGESFECEYSPTDYRVALADSLFRRQGSSNQCFKKAEKRKNKHGIYCAPELSDYPNLLTGKRCANCRGDLCFVTSIKKEPDWREYGLIHILEIAGYNVLEETEAGLIPVPAYIRFVVQINKAVSFYKRLVCKECGHILFPAQPRGYTKFKCLMPTCPEYNKEVYLNYCHDCKRGLIDSRETKQCPNGVYICPTCHSCCSNAFFESMAERYRIVGKAIPAFISKNIGKGHKDLKMVFCPKCGAQLTRVYDSEGKSEWRCLSCNPGNDSAPDYYGV